ncbi:FAD-binding oxidoreductase [Nocardioides sp. GXZ039]|uniref:FAD-binding oxidoreductase n=1 Tax=Nocardioides sp. GXZ039 TaxID=3136018 RepID=UPI0030F456BF
MASASVIDFGPLEGALPEGALILEPDRMAGYRFDRANDPDAGTPRAVVRATSTPDVQAAVRFAGEHGLAIVTRGAGTGLSGGATAVDGCLVISTERMRGIEVDPHTRTAVVEPGLLNAEVKAAVAEHGLWYPPDPSSYEICSIGGNVATNAGGLCCAKYGVTTDYVLGLTVVLADGTAVELGGPRLKDVAGLSLTKLFVGSEGTLGIVTRIVLRLLPAPHPPATLVASFASLDDACRTVLDITRRLRPAMLELMDGVTIAAVEDLTHMGLDRSAAAILVMQSDESGDAAAREIETMSGACEANGATECYFTTDPEEGEAFVAARRMAIPALEGHGSLLLEDVGVPLTRLGDLVLGIAEIAAARDVRIAVIAHAADGNTHPLLVLDPTDTDQHRRAHTAYGEIMELAVSLGGTITGEHGVGRLKQPWLGHCVGDDVLALNRRIKDALDPRGLLNPGTMFEI